MSWRTLLGVSPRENYPVTQFPQNTQKQTESIGSANNADSAQGTRKLQLALAEASLGLPISITEVHNALSTDDIHDWYQGQLSQATLDNVARCVVQRREMNQGKVPETYTEHAHCKNCGPIWLWFSGDVIGCPWCWNRLEGRPIPRPSRGNSEGE